MFFYYFYFVVFFYLYNILYYGVQVIDFVLRYMFVCKVYLVVWYVQGFQGLKEEYLLMFNVNENCILIG